MATGETVGRVVLAAGAKTIHMPGNTDHAFHPWLQERVPVPVLATLGGTSATAPAMGSTTFDVLVAAGPVVTDCYQDVFEHRGLTLRLPSGHPLCLISSPMSAIGVGQFEEAQDQVRVAARVPTDEGVETLIVGCTERSPVLPQLSASCAVIKALDVLGRTAVGAAHGALALHASFGRGGATDVA